MDQELPHNIEPKKPEAAGPTVAIIVILIILVIGGLYYLMTSVQKVNDAKTAEEDRQEIQNLKTQGSDDTAAAIQADLDATDLTPVDESVQAVDQSAN